MNNLQKLYQTILDARLINDSYDDFSKAMLDENYQKKVFEAITKQDLFNQDFDTFKSAYASQAGVGALGTTIKEKLAIGAYSMVSAFNGIGDYANALSTNVEVFFKELVGDELTLEEKQDIFTKGKMGNIQSQLLEAKLFNYIGREGGTISNAIKEGKYGDAADKTVDGMIEAIPSLIAARLGPWGMVALGVSTAGNKFEQELFSAEEDANVGNLLLNASGSGTIEAGFEIVTRGLLKRANLISDQVTTEAAKEFLKEGTLAFGKKVVGSFLAEGFSEAATTLVSNYFDAYSLNKQRKEGQAGQLTDDLISLDLESQFVQELGDSFIIGAAVGKSIEVAGGLNKLNPKAKERAYNTLMDVNDQAALNEIAKEADVLQKAYKETKDKKSKKVIEEKMLDLVARANRIKGNNKLTIDAMTDEALDEYVQDIESQIELKRSYRTAKSEEERKILKDKFNSINNRIESIRESARNEVLEEFSNNVKAYADDTGSQYERFSDTKEFQKRYEELGGDPSLDVTDRDGVFVGGVMLQNDVVAKETGAISVASHEFIHRVFGKKFDNLTDKQKINLNKSFYNILTDSQKAAIKKRFVENNEDINGEPDFKSEEMFTYFDDAINKKEISFDESFGNRILNFSEEVLRLVGKRGEFENGRQAYNFMKNYNKTIKKGKRSKRVTEFAAKDKIQVGETTQTKASLTKISDKAKQISSEVDAIGKKAKTKAEFDAGVNIEAYNYLIDGEGLTGLIKARLAKQGINTEGPDANVNGVPIANYIEDVKAKLIPDVLGFNPEAETTEQGKFGLSGYINQRLGFRMGDVAKAAKKAPTGRSLDAPIDDSGRTAAELVEGEADPTLARLEEENLGFLYVNSQNRSQETEQDKNELKSRYRHKLKNNDGSKLIGETQVESVREGVRTTLRRLKDNVTSDKFLLNFENMVKKTMKNIVQKSIGSGVSYRQFVLNNFEAIVDFSTVQDLVAMERLVGKGKLKDGKKIFTVPIRRLTTQEDIQKAIDQGKLPPDAINKSAEGVFLSEKRMPTQEELQAFFFGVNMQEVLGYELGASTLGTRKDGLSRMIVTELSQDAMMETMQEPKIMEELVAANPDIATEVMVNDIAVKVNRAPGLKFSYTAKQKSDYRKGLRVLNAGNSETSAKFLEFAKNTDKETLNRVRNKFRQRKFEKFLQSDDVISQAELDALGNDIKLHKKYEIIAGNRLRSMLKELKLDNYTVEKPSETDNNQDVRVIDRTTGKVVLALEIKGDTARGVSVSVNYKKGKKVVASKEVYGDKQKAIENDIKKVFEDIITVAKEFDNNAVSYTDQGNLEISYEAIQQIVRGNNNIHYLAYDIEQTITFKQFAEAYQQKQGKEGLKPSHAIDIKGRGLIDMSMQNADLKIEGLTKAEDIKTEIPLQVRIDFGKIKNNGMVTVSARIEPQLSALDMPAQNFSLLNKKDNKNVKSNIKFSKSKKLSVAQNITKASDQARTQAYFSKTKGASIFDFDETVGISENVIIATKEGVTKKIPSDQWPFVGEDLANQGYEFDFTDFNKVTKGKPGPLLPKMKNQIKKYGPDNVFILTARAPESAEAIHAWLKSEGVNIPLKNITGLGNSTGEAKAMWVLNKYANEGYNDMYFVDDAITNVQAVQNIFDQLDIKGKSVQAKMKFSNTKKQSFDDVLKRRSIEVQSATISSINNTIDANVNLDTYSQIKFSKTHRDAYEARLTKKRTDLDEKQIKGAVESVFKFVEGENIPKNKKSKFEKLAFHYMANGYLILPEDGYKVIEAERIATIKKIDPFSYKNPNLLIEKFAGEVKGVRTNPDTVKEFTNKTNVGQGVTVYDVEYSKEGQLAVRKVIDTHFGKKADPWCLVARMGGYYASDQAYSKQERDQMIADQEAVGRYVEVTEYKEDGQTVYELTIYNPKDSVDSLDSAYDHWKSYNKKGNGFKIAFKNGKLLCFRDGNEKRWWDRNDKPSDKIHFTTTEKKGNVESVYDVTPEDGAKVLTRRTKGKMPTAEVYTRNEDNNYIYESDVNYVDGRAESTRLKTTYKDKRLSQGIGIYDGVNPDIQLNNLTKDVQTIKNNVITNVYEGKVVLTSKQFKEFENKAVEIKHVTNAQTSENISLTINGVKQDIGVKFSRTKKQSFDSILKRNLGIDQDIDPARAKIIGAKKGKREFFIAPGADDFQGLMMRLAGKGEQGESDIKFFKQVFFDPFNRAYRKLNSIQYNMMESYAQTRKEHKGVIKKLKKKFDNEFTNEDAIRIYLWDLQDLDVPGLTTKERKAIAAKVAQDADMVEYAFKVRKSLQIEGDQYLAPTDTWTASSIKGDMYNSLNKVHRDGALEEWQENVDELLNNEAQLAKLEAAMGTDYVEALKDMLYRMKTGKNRPSGQNASTNKALNWLQGSVGAIMFFNMRSAVLQTISTVNFINHTDNNIFAFSKAIANVPQFAKDFKMLFNSPQLKVRRSGLQQDIQTADLADSLSRGGGASNVLAYLLKIGFTPTQVADSFAIAFGGATFYRNRVNSLMKQGMTQDQAESQAMIDFQDITEESQQSSRPDRISKQQASPLGRLLLAFQNTPLQYNRIIKKAVSDIANKRGNVRDHLSRIAYYGAIQSLIFYSLQQALFAEDEPEEEQIPSGVKKEYAKGIKDGTINKYRYPDVTFYYADVKSKQKKESLVNSMADGWLRGSGIKGAMVSTFKNVVRSFMKESEKGFKADYFNTFIEMLNLSPQIGSKARKIKRASDTYKYNKDVIAEIGAFDIDNPAYPMITSLTEGLTNAPVHRIYTKLDNLKEAFNEDNTAMQRLFVALGWNQWQMGIDTYKDVREAKEKIKEKKKAKKKQCRRILSNGKRCSIRTTNKSELCYHHD